MATAVSNSYCDIELSILRASPYLLVQGDSVFAKVQAQNPIGWSPESAVNAAVIAEIKTEPASPSQTPTRGTNSSYTQLIADWVALTGTDTGGSPILSYHLQYDDSSNGTLWTDLIGHSSDSLALTYTVSSSIQVPKTYFFRYRAKNVHGWSGWSPNLSLIAASVPDVVLPAAVTFNDGTNARIQWTLPAYDGGMPITAYAIYVKATNGSFYTSDATCNGTDATIRANLYCLVPISTLRAAPFSLALDDLVLAQVTATNVIGTNVASTANTAGAVVKTEPAQPAAPTRDDASTTDA